MLNDFSEHFLQSRTLDELLRIESTSLRIRDAERAREAKERLAQNKSALPTKYYEVRAGRDNRWSEIHPARFLHCYKTFRRIPPPSPDDARLILLYRGK